MKMKKILTTFTAATLGSAFAPAALATCDYGKTGFLYVWETCVATRVQGNPRHVCQIRDTGNGTKAVLMISNVIRDDGSNGRYPSSQFFDETQIQLNVSQNGSESHCYATRQEAEDDQRKMIADYKRDDYIIKRVRLRNS